jgi:hypothetical protein
VTITVEITPVEGYFLPVVTMAAAMLPALTEQLQSLDLAAREHGHMNANTIL